MNEKNTATMIKNILTLRYDSSLKTNWDKFSSDDFEPKESIDHIESIEKIIIDSITRELDNNEKRISVALSGGVDSILVMALLRKVFPDIEVEAISVKFADSVDETKTAHTIAEKFGANHHIIPIENFLEELPKAISIIKMPFWDTHWYHVAKTAIKFSKTLVSGDGGDELFGGYTFRYEKFLLKVNPKMSPLEKTKLYLDCHERDWVPDQDDLFGTRSEFSWDKIYSQLLPYFDNSIPPIDQVFLADINGKLPYNWSPLNRSFHEFFNLKAITPILSKELMLYATHLNHKLKYNEEKKLGKLPLRKILDKYVSPDLISSKKQGFSVNTVNLWESHGRKLCDYYLDDARIVKDGWINKNWIDKHFKILNKNPNPRYINKFLGLLAFEVWYRIFVTKEMNENTILNT